MRVGDLVHVVVEGECLGYGEIVKQYVGPPDGDILERGQPMVHVRFSHKPDAPEAINECWCDVIAPSGQMFSLDYNQRATLADWLEKHKELAERYQGAIAGGLTYSFTPMSLGLVTVVTLLKGLPAEISLNLTPYDEW